MMTSRVESYDSASTTFGSHDGNAAAITDALRNLIENALVHTPPGTEVVVEVDPKGAISVQDSGPGIPAEDRQRIFERFWRGKGVRTDGAGLGLAIVMEIVRAHGASVTVSNRIPRGARFDVRFRAAEGPDGKSVLGKPCRSSISKADVQGDNALSIMVSDPSLISKTRFTGRMICRS